MGGILVALTIAVGTMATPALAGNWPGTDPTSNFPLPDIPQICWSSEGGDPIGAACLDWSVGVLDQARASLGEPAYVLPSDFDSLSPAQQLLILTDDDRAQYGLDPIPGLTDALDQDAQTGVQTDNDPWPTGGSWMAYASNWAGGYVNVVQAYEGWMYDDGPGSGNVDCTSGDPSGCWGHRHDILWEFDPTGGQTAMGAAAGSDSAGTPGYAMLLVQGSDSSYRPTYTYTWEQAVADGAGGGLGSGSGSGDGTGAGSGTGSGSSGSGSSGTGSGTGTGSGSGTGTGSGSSTGSQPGSGSGKHSGGPGAHIAVGPISLERVRVHGHRISFRVLAPRGIRLSCALRHWNGRSWRTERLKSCTFRTVFRHVAAGRYNLRIRSLAATLIRHLAVR